MARTRGRNRARAEDDDERVGAKEYQPDLTVRNRYGGVSVIPASERGHVDYVRRVVQTDIDVNHVNDLGWTALLESKHDNMEALVASDPEAAAAGAAAVANQGNK